MKSDDEDPIAAYTTLPGVHCVLRVDTSSNGRGKIYLEGHDISHLVCSYEIRSEANEANRVILELTNIRIGS